MFKLKIAIKNTNINQFSQFLKIKEFLSTKNSNNRKNRKLIKQLINIQKIAQAAFIITFGHKIR